jgi:hypothetical protein
MLAGAHSRRADGGAHARCLRLCVVGSRSEEGRYFSGGSVDKDRAGEVKMLF